MRYVLISMFAVGTMLLTLSSHTIAEEADIPLHQVPKAVLDAIKTRFPQAKLTRAAKETEDGKPTYEVSLDYKEHEYSIAATAAGKITEVEREIDIADLPKAASEAIRKKYPGGKIEKAEEVTANDKMTYEVIVEKSDDKDVEVTVDASGKILSEKPIQEEDDDDDDDDQ